MAYTEFAVARVRMRVQVFTVMYGHVWDRHMDFIVYNCAWRWLDC